jgi:hypothetical protein
VSSEQERIAAELARVREGVRERALGTRAPNEVLPAPLATRTPEAVPNEAAAAPRAEVLRPDGSAVNAAWDISKAPTAAGLRGRLAGFVRRLLSPTLEAQVRFNSQQVQLDNQMLAYIDARLDATHRHYDAVLGIHGRHMQEIDERHLILQEELVAHVHDLVRRIDLVLSEADRGRLSLEFALKDLRARLVRLEERLPRG